MLEKLFADKTATGLKLKHMKYILIPQILHIKGYMLRTRVIVDEL